MASFVRNMKKADDAIEETGSKWQGLGKLAGRAGDTLQSVGKVALGGLALGATAAIGAVGGLAVGIGKLTMAAADVEGTRKTFEALHASIGEDGVAALEMYRQASRGMVSDQDLMESSNKFVAMGLASTAEEAAQLTEISTQLGMAMGEDATASMENFALMLANQSIPRLDSFGISSGAVRERIKELMEANEDMDRETAFMTATMEQAALTMDKVGEQGDTAGAGMARMEATFANAKLQIGQAFLPVMGKLMSKFNEFVDMILPPLINMVGLVAESFDIFLQRLEHGIGPAELVSGLIGALGESFGIAEEPAGKIAETVGNLVQGFLDFVEAARPIVENVIQWAIDFGLWKDILIVLGASILSVIIPAILSFVAAAAPVVATIVAIIAVVALLRKAWETDFGGIRTATIKFWDKTLKPAFEDLSEWLGDNLPIAIEKLKKFWEDILLPAINRVWQFISEFVLPILKETWEWVSENLPIALERLRSFWEDVLLPALEKAWTYFSKNIIPILVTAAETARDVLGAAIETLSSIWTEILLPALKIVWGFIKGSLLPLVESLAHLFGAVLKKALEAIAGIFQNVLGPAIETSLGYLRTFADFIEKTIGPIMEKLGNVILPAVKSGFDGIASAIQTVIGWIESLADWLDRLELPDWADPGSPTPFELGLRGMSRALKTLAGQDLPKLKMELVGLEGMSSQIQAAVSPVVGGGGGGAVTNVANSAVTNQYNLTTQSTTRPGGVAMEFEAMGMASR